MENFTTRITDAAAPAMIRSAFGIYEYPVLALGEYVSNAVDEPADRRPEVSLAEHPDQGWVFTVRDFAAGMSRETLRERVGNLDLSNKREGQIGGKGIGTKAGLALTDKVVFRTENADGAHILILRRDGENTLFEDDPTGTTGTTVTVTFDEDPRDLIRRLVSLQRTLDFELFAPSGDIDVIDPAMNRLAEVLGVPPLIRFHPVKPAVVTVAGFNYGTEYVRTVTPARRATGASTHLLEQIACNFTLALDPSTVTIPRHREHLVAVDLPVNEALTALWHAKVAPKLLGDLDEFRKFVDLASAAGWSATDLTMYRVTHHPYWKQAAEILGQRRYFVFGAGDPVIMEGPVLQPAMLAEAMGMDQWRTRTGRGLVPVDGSRAKTERSPDALALVRAFKRTNVVLALDGAHPEADNLVLELVELFKRDLHDPEHYADQLAAYTAYKARGERKWPGILYQVVSGSVVTVGVEHTLAEWRALAQDPHVEIAVNAKALSYTTAGVRAHAGLSGATYGKLLAQAIQDTGKTVYIYTGQGAFRAQARKMTQQPSSVAERVRALVAAVRADDERRAHLPRIVRVVRHLLQGGEVPYEWSRMSSSITDEVAAALRAQLAHDAGLTPDENRLVAQLIEDFADGSYAPGSSWSRDLHDDDPVLNYLDAVNALREPVRGGKDRATLARFLNPNEPVDKVAIRAATMYDVFMSLITAFRTMDELGYPAQRYNILDLYLYGNEYVQASQKVHTS